MTDRNEALRLADELAGDQLYGLQRRCRDEAAALLRQQAERIAELEGERDQHKHTATSLLSLLADIRMACGDNGKRMQPELVEFIGSLTAERDQLRAEVERLRSESVPLGAIRGIAVEAIRDVIGFPDLSNDGKHLSDTMEETAQHATYAAIDQARTTHKDEG